MAGSIALPADAAPNLRAGADDAQQALAKMTGHAYPIVSTYNGAGIRLMRSDEKQVPLADQRRLAGLGREPFVIRWEDDHLTIVANSDDGLCHGLYYYLDQLGCRWYLPNENWTIVPKRQDIRIAIDKLVVPAFKLRGFFGTGGYGTANRNRYYDLDNKVPGQWAAWQRRNRFGGEFVMHGHEGEDFNSRNKAVLLKHPEYLAEINGKHVPLTPGAKPDVGNPELVQLYVADRLEAMRKIQKAAPNSPYSYAVSVEPADGGGYGNSGDCLQIGNGSPSDQTFYLANKAAEAIAAEFPQGHVSLLAYGEHAAPPSFPLDPNVFVEVTPYGFQRTGLTPEELIDAWSHKLPEMGIYDYWSIPDWAQDQPNFDYVHMPAQKIRFWAAHHVVAFTGESTYSAGAIGLGWYIGSRLMWDPQTDVDGLLNDFYNGAFGPARAPMQRMLERWATSFLLTDNELAFSYRDLLEARHLAAGDAAVMARLDDYGMYLQYLRLLYEFRNPASAEARASAAHAYLKYVWSIDHSAMVHSFRLTELMLNRYFPDADLTQEFDAKSAAAAGWQNIVPPTHDEIEAFLADGAERYKPLDFDQRSYREALVPVNAAAAPATVPTKTMNFIGYAYFELQVPPSVHSLPIGAGGLKPIKATLTDLTGKQLYNEFVGPGGVQIPIPAAGRYRLSMISQSSQFSATLPMGVDLTMTGFLNSQGSPLPRLYFYVPRGLKTIAVYFDYILIPRFLDGGGNTVSPRAFNAPGISLIDVPPGQDGKIWSLVNVKAPKAMRMLNVPQDFAFAPEELLVPADALR